MARFTALQTRLFGDDSPLYRALRSSQMGVALSGTPPLALGTMANSAIVAYVFRNSVPWPVLGGWVLLNWIAAARRLRAWHRNRNRPPQQRTGYRGLWRTTVWTALAGVLWGLCAIPLVWSNGLLQETVIVFMIAGHAAVAATWLSPIPAACWAYLFPTMVPLIASIAVQGSDHAAVVALMLTLYAAVLVHFGQASYRNFRQAVRANVEREAAMQQLAESKAQVEQKVLERTEDLRREQLLVQAVFDAVPIWLFLKDAEGRFLAVNHRMAKDLGKHPEQLVGRQFVDVSTLPEGEAAVDARTDKEALASGRMVGLAALKCTAADGKLHTLRMVKVPLSSGDNGADTIVGVAEDITERNRLEQQLHHAQKLQAVGQLAGGVAHEFNNLLQVIRGFTHLAMRDLPPRDPARSHMMRVIDSTVTAASLTSQLLSFGRRDIVRRETIDLAALMSRMMAMFRHILGEAIEITLTQEPNLPPLVADRGMLEQAVMNLCLNARDAMPKGGKLLVETRTLAAQEPVNHLLGLGRPGDYLEIRITDTGVGMPPEVLERIFEPFFTTKEVGNGSGLGLSVAYGIVEQHGGRIRVQSQPGQGACFSILLPAAGPADLPDTPARPDVELAKVPPRQSATILVAEDDDAVRHLAVELLELEGFRVIQANNGVQAVQAWENATEPVDLLILDLVMPGQGGREAYERIASLQGDIPVIFCTGYVADTLDSMFLSDSKAMLLRKPYGPDRLLQAVHEALESAGRREDRLPERPHLPA